MEQGVQKRMRAVIRDGGGVEDDLARRAPTLGEGSFGC